MAGRLLLLVAALAAGVYGVRAEGRESRCRGALVVAAHKGFGEPLGDGPGLVHRVQAECRGSHRLVQAADALITGGHVPEAIALTDVALRREPGNFEGWAVLARALETRGLSGPAQRARARAHRLNPRGVPARAALRQG
jgi:hypothetical protein